MTYCSGNSASKDNDLSTQVLGETGDTIVYVFANGNARVKKGKKIIPASSHDRSVLNQGNMHNASPSHPNYVNPIQPPPPPLRPQPTVEKPDPQPRVKPLTMVNVVQSNTEGASQQKSSTETLLAEYLISKNLVTAVQIEVAQYDSNASGLSLEDVLLARGWVAQEAIAQFQQTP